MKEIRLGRVSALLGFMLLMLILSSCGGLAGEPVVVSTLRPAPTKIATSSAPFDRSQISIAQGQAIFIERCSACHGIGGRGDGELVKNGQLTNVADLTDPVLHEGKTLEQYYEVITYGRIEKMMPPWENALTEVERWSVAQYAFNLIGNADSTEELPVSTEEAQAESTASVVVPPAESTAIPVQTGTVTGSITNGTAGASVPKDTKVALHVMDLNGNIIDYPEIVATDGTYRFSDIELSPEKQYIMTAVYQDILFIGQPVSGNGESTLDVPITVYETTDDVSILSVDLLLNQALPLDETSVAVTIIASFRNTSDRVFVTNTPANETTKASVSLRVPEGASYIGSNQEGRFVLSQDGKYLLDTAPVIPNMQHVVQATFAVPYLEGATVSYTLDYPLVNDVELILPPDTFTVESTQFVSQGEFNFTSGTYVDYLAPAPALGEPIRFTLKTTPMPSVGASTSDDGRGTLAIVLVGAGVLLLGTATGLYLRERRQGNREPLTTEQLIAQIAELDKAHDEKTMSQSAYQKQRATLKAQLAELMKKPSK